MKYQIINNLVAALILLAVIRYLEKPWDFAIVMGVVFLVCGIATSIFLERLDRHG